MNYQILFVDDDPNILAAYKRTLYNKFTIDTAQSGEEGLEKLMTNKNFSVVVADMRMPHMDGINFLMHVRKFNSDIVRIMLTGNADIQTAIDAVNDGNVFRFLTKPCPPEMLISTLNAAIAQYKLIVAEQVLLKKTLTGSVKVLVDILGIVNPAAFSRASRIKKITHHIVSELSLPNQWLYDVAAMLSQIGCVSLPVSLLNKIYSQTDLNPEEKRMYSTHPVIGSNLLSKIPRLEKISEIIKNQNLPFSHFNNESDIDKIVATGSQMLKIAIDFDYKIIGGYPKKDVIKDMKLSPNIYNPEMVETLNSYKCEIETQQSKLVYVKDLIYGMIANHDIKSRNGLLLVSKGQEITYPVIAKLQNFSKNPGVEEPFEVLMPSKSDMSDI